ncbi:DNA polymerase IV [Gordonia sp. (in: high G+C Gram-positive bacteria)]|uniref:DNA polymerase IV n=1 Tax=Gordonia sp. (in: high G+C Gram-positive bacteria) TaxID=84139 RepID=UPI00168F913B|nr:DNA polymerase IV [Gordonia sp. (in: high G+C Gram-positive bacteria)]NLG46613.1 DNA polymerase IV [Gordonia sp. (in: high G+C Gram-positive bacteria)]
MAESNSERSARWVLHIDMDAFFASVEQLTRPTLAGRPVLVGGLGGRGVVAGASYESRAFGAHSAMPMHQARRLVGGTAVVVPPRGSVYRVVSERVFAIMRTFVPVIETLSFDEAFGEPSELIGATVDEAAAFAEALRTAIRDQVGLPASVGFGSGKQIAKIASGEAKPDGIAVIPPSRELDFLQSLPVRKLWGVGPVTGDRLARLGVETIGHLAALSEPEVVSVLGATVGPSLHRLAQGIDTRPVAERAEAKQISAESTFAVDIVDAARLRAAVSDAAAHAHRRLLADGRGARTVVVKLRRSDMSILTRSITLPAATTDLDGLTAAAHRVMLDPLEVGPIRLVGVGYSGLSETRQETLFPGLGEFLDEAEAVAAEDDSAASVSAAVSTEEPTTSAAWPTGADVFHAEHGHGWVQGGGHGFVTIRFETRATGPGRAQTFRLPDPTLQRADPLDSLAWELTEAVDGDVTMQAMTL